MSTTIFDFMIVGSFEYLAFNETAISAANEGARISRPEGGGYGTYSLAFTVRLPGRGVYTGVSRTFTEWMAFLRTMQGAHDTWLWKDPLVSYLYEVLVGDADGQIGTGDGTIKSFALNHRFIDELTLKVYINAVLQPLTTAYTISGNNGDAPTIEFVLAPTTSLPITVSYDFFYPVTFISDPGGGAFLGANVEFSRDVEIKEEYAGAHRV